MQQYFEKAHIVPKVRSELTSSEAGETGGDGGTGLSDPIHLSVSKRTAAERSDHPVTGLPLQNSGWSGSGRKTPARWLQRFEIHTGQIKQSVYDRQFPWISASLKPACLAEITF